MEQKFQKRDILKVGIESVVGYGVGFIITSAVDSLIPHNLSTPKKMAIRLSSFAVSWAVTSAATKNVNTFIDALADGVSVGYAAGKAERQTTEYKDMQEFMSADAPSAKYIDPDHIVYDTPLDFPEEPGDTDER